MPQLDLLLFSSQCLAGVLFVTGFMYFSKIVLPYISLFVKAEELELLDLLDISNDLMEDQDILLELSTLNSLFIKDFCNTVQVFERKLFNTSVLL